MSVSAATLRKLIDAGLSGDALIDVVESIEADRASQAPVIDEQAERRRAQDRERKRVRRNSADNSAEPSADKTNKEKVAPKENKKNIISITREAEFSETFWPAYPRKVAKPGALKAFRKARDKASLSEIMAGLGRYQSQKPEYADWRHPATWLNDEGWADDYGPPPPKRTNPNAKPKTGSAAMLDALKEFSNEPDCKTDDFDGRTIEGTASRASRQGGHSGDARPASDSVSHGGGW